VSCVQSKGSVYEVLPRFARLAEVENFSALTTNSRSVSERGRNLGWTTVAKSLEDTLEEDIDAVIASTK
jgi:hypothetical protein